MFDRFTQSTRSVFSRARGVAIELHHDFIGGEHVLLALAGEQHGLAARALSSHGLDEARVRADVLRRLPPGSIDAGPGPMPFTHEVKRALELAREEAKSSDHAHVTTGHVLLALLQVEDGAAAATLAGLGLRLADARERLKRLPPLPERVHPREP